ncbi:hypothetical protein FB446DRAFT_349077 [Lentinula raphanica]|nr:hypothetical protein FB446DRAFT_349077 [Lentinula raphanica]
MPLQFPRYQSVRATYTSPSWHCVSYPPSLLTMHSRATFSTIFSQFFLVSLLGYYIICVHYSQCPSGTTVLPLRYIFLAPCAPPLDVFLTILALCSCSLYFLQPH